MRLLFRKILYLLPILLLIVSINYFVDPANIFNEKKYVTGIANYIVNGYNVTNVNNFNERTLQKELIERIKDCPTEIALGGSRIMQLNTSNTNNLTFFNNGVSGATLEDLIAIYYLYEKKGCKIKTVFLGLESYYLNDNHGQDRWKTLEDEYAFLSNKLNNTTALNANILNTNKYIKYKELFSFSYFKTSVLYLFKPLNKKYIPTKSTINKGFTRLKDGSIGYDARFLNTSITEVDNKANTIIASKTIYSLGNFTTLSIKYKNDFENFILYLQNKNIEIKFLLSPYHPIVYKHFEREKYYRIVSASEDYFKNLASLHHIKVYGSFNPAKYNLDNTFFLDAFHCKETALEKILKAAN